MWGFITQQVQLLNMAVVLIVALSEKKKSSSLYADCGESDPWQAFLVPSVPNKALILEGDSDLAFIVLVGPNKLLHLLIASSQISSNPTTKSEVIKLINVLKNYFP